MNKLRSAVLLAVFIGAQLWFSFIIQQFPYIGIILEKNMQEEWSIKKFENSGEGVQLNLKQGDVIKQIDGRNPNEHVTVQKWRAIDQAKSIVVSRAGTEITINTMEINSRHDYDFFSLFGEIVSLFFGALLYIKLSRSVSAYYLSLVFLTIAGIYMALGASIRGDALGKLFESLLVMTLPIVFLHFLIVFFKEKGKVILPSKFIKYLYGFILLIFVTKLSYFSTSLAYTFYKFSNPIVILFFLFGLLLNFTILTYTYFKYRRNNPSISIIIKTVWFSLFVSFMPFACFSFLPKLLFHQEWINSFYTGSFILFFPLSFAYLIITKRLFDLDIVLRRILYLTVISIIPSTVVTGLNLFIFQKEATFSHLIISFLTMIIILTFVLYSLEYFTTRFEKVMFPRKFYLQNALKSIAKNLSSITNFRELKETILVDIVRTLQVFGGAIVFKYKKGFEIISEGDIDLTDIEQMSTSDTFDHPDYSCFVINQHEEYTSYLIITQKRTQTLLGMEETQWLNLITTYVSVSLENIYLLRKLTMKLHQMAAQIPNEQGGKDIVWFRKSMFEMQENERYRIATDLHDTTMQDILFVKKRLLLISENNELPLAEQKKLGAVIKHLELVNENLRQSCFELHPYLLQRIGLIDTLYKVIDIEIGLCDFEIQFQPQGKEIIENLDIGTKRHIFRIIQELLNNAKKHSKATIVTIKINILDRDLCLLYNDNGIGYDLETAATDERLRMIGNSGQGIEQMKSRILHLNGHLEIDSKRGLGVKLSIRIPMKEGMIS